MFIKDFKVYPDTGEKLVGGESCGVADMFNSAIQNGINFIDTNTCRVGGISYLTYNNGWGHELPDDRTFNSIYKMFLELGYTSEEQLSILMAKDKSDIDATAFSNMLVWMDFADKAAKLACPKIGIAIEETVDSVRNEKLKDIAKYDESADVNSFTYNGISLWLDKATRVGLMNSTAILQNAGEETTTLWLGTVNVTLKCTDVILMLSKIEMYALECYNVTAQHKAEVESITDIDKIKEYDYKVGYPDRLVFNI